MKINILKGYFIRLFFIVTVLLLPLLIMGFFSLLFLDDLIFFWTLFGLYFILLIISSSLIFIVGFHKFEYRYLIFDIDSFSLINKESGVINFEDSMIYIDNPILGLLVSPYHLIFNYEIKYDFIIKDKKNNYTRVYLTFRDYFRIKKNNYIYEYIRI